MARTLIRGGMAPAMLISLGLLAGGVPTVSLVTAQPAAAQLTGTLSGSKFIEQAAMSGMFEIEAAKIALEKSTAPKIRAFAEKMIRDHQAMAADLKAAVQKADGQMELPAKLDGKHETMIERLRAAVGSDFDTLYTQMQTQAHDAAVGIFATYEKDGDQTALRDFARDALPMLKTHLADAKALDIKT